MMHFYRVQGIEELYFFIIYISRKLLKVVKVMTTNHANKIFITMITHQYHITGTFNYEGVHLGLVILFSEVTFLGINCWGSYSLVFLKNVFVKHL